MDFKPPAPVRDAGRLAELRATGILDSPPEESFDRMTRLARHLLGAPVALASFVDAERQFFKSLCGDLPEPFASARQSPLSHSFCQYVVGSGELLVVENAREHPLVRDNRAVSELGVLAYAGAPIHAPGGAVLGSFCVVDTRERIWTERELEILSDLAAAVDAEIALRQARREADAANRAKSEFLANMSHEIRTPMNAVIGVTELLLQTELKGDQRHYVEMIRSSGDALLEVINDILDLSRIEAGKMELDPAPFRLEELLGALRPLDVKARQKGLGFSLAVDPRVPAGFLGDRGRIGQILVNLVGNAIKFTMEGEVGVAVAPAESAGHRGAVRFSVRDTGIGIRPERRDAIFESFSQEDASTTRHHGGTGLGLTISRDLAHLMGGRIWLESEVGVGSEFHVELPLEAAALEEMPAVRQRGSKVTTRTLRVLLAEDNPVNQLVARHMLELDGHEVTVVADGDQALHALEAGGVDVALMDIQMPEMDGLDASRTWRERESRGGSRVPIIALTAHAMESDRERALAAGMDGYLTKPLRLEDLRAALAAHVPDGPADPAQDPAGEADGAAEDKAMEGAAFTRDRFLHAVEGEEELLVELARVWGEQGAAMVGAVDDALRAGDASALEFAAHRLKGAALAVGATALAEAAVALEAAAREGRAAPQDAARRLRAAAGAVDRVVLEILVSAG